MLLVIVSSQLGGDFHEGQKTPSARVPHSRSSELAVHPSALFASDQPPPRDRGRDADTTDLKERITNELAVLRENRRLLNSFIQETDLCSVAA